MPDRDQKTQRSNAGMLTPLVITLAVPCLFALDLLSLGIVLRAPLLVQQLASLHLCATSRRPA